MSKKPSKKDITVPLWSGSMASNHIRGKPCCSPLSLDEFIPAGHRTRIISAVVDRLDLNRLYNTYCTTVGQDAYDPRMLVKVLFSGCARIHNFGHEQIAPVP